MPWRRPKTIVMKSVADRAQLEQAEVGERDRTDREEDGEERLPRDRRAEALVRAREHVVHRRGEGEVGLEHVQILAGRRWRRTRRRSCCVILPHWVTAQPEFPALCVKTDRHSDDHQHLASK